MEQLNLDQFIEEALVSCGGTDVLIEIVESVTSSAFHGLNWEIMEQYLHSTTGSVGAKSRFIFTRTILNDPDNASSGMTQSLSLDNSRGQHNPSPQRSFNILLVVSRPRKEDDIDPLLGAKALNDVILKLSSGLTDAPVNLEIVRPGSWKAFKAYIGERTQRWWSSGGHGRWFDMVHFDVHGIVRDGSPWLMFLSASGKTLLCSADLIAEVLIENFVPLVVLHSCESAKATLQRTNLAKILVEHGVERVVAMAFKLTGTAAQIFVRSFYYHLLADRSRNELAALHAARSVLFKNPVRLGKLDQDVVLPDYFVPVIYASADFTRQYTSDHVFKTSSSIELLEAAEEFGKSFADPKLTQSVLGREQDILKMEWLLLRKGHPNIALITGPVGVGKTALAKFLGNWWMKTMLISSCKYWSMKEYDPAKALKYLRAWSASRPECSSRSPSLFIVDHMDAVTGTTQPSKWTLDESQKRHWVEIFQTYRSRRDLIILISRTSEDWFQLEESQKHTLGGLSNTDALALASRVMKEIGWGSFLNTPSTLEQLECFVNRVDRNPLSIEFLLRGSKYQVDRLKRNGWASSHELTTERPDHMLPDDPDHLLQFLLLAFVTDEYQVGGLPQFQECSGYIERLLGMDYRNSLVLLSLLPLFGIYCEDWYMAVRHRMSELRNAGPVPDDQYFKNFVTEKLVDAGWAEHVANIATNDGTQHRCIRIHPLFISCLRFKVMLSPDLQKLAEIVWVVFVIHETTWAYLRTTWLNWRKWYRQVQFRATSLLAACTMGYNIAVLNNAATIQPYYVHITLNLLWGIAIGSNTPILTPVMLFSKMEQLLDYTKKRLAAGKDDVSSLHNQDYVGANIDVVLRTCEALSSYFLDKSCQKSAGLLDNLIKHVAMTARRGVDWDHNERRFCLAKCLTTFSSCCLRQCELKKARRLASLALRCYKSGESDIEKARDVTTRCRAYQILFSVAIVCEENSETVAWYREHAQAALDDRDSIMGIDLADMRPQLNMGTFRDYLGNTEKQDVDENLPNIATNMPPRMARIQRLVKEGDVDSAKAALYDDIDKAQKTGNVAAEGSFHADLIEISIASEDWLDACMHIQRLDSLFSIQAHGPWELPHHYDVLDMYDSCYRFARYGSVFLQLQTFIPSMLYFWRALDAVRIVTSSEYALPDDPDQFVGVAMTIIRANLCMLVGLPRKLISPGEFNRLDDIGQELVMRYVQDVWPDFDLASKGIKERLKRAYDVFEAFDVGGPPKSEPSSHDVITLTKIVADLSRAENGEQKLPLGFFERGLDIRPNVHDELDDPDLDSIEDCVALSRGIVKPDNPRC